MTHSLESAAGLLTVPQAAELMSCSNSHIYNLINAHELATVDISVPKSTKLKRRIRVADLMDFIERSSVDVT